MSETIAGDSLDEVLDGMAGEPKMLPCKYLYDERGSALFERICDLPEYYLTRTENVIMRAHIGDIADVLGAQCTIIEFGSGNSTKTTFLLDHLDDPVGYVPIDISREALHASSQRLRDRYPDLHVLPVCADFHQEIRVPDTARPARRTIVYFPGSTIGNFEEHAARAFLDRIARAIGPDGALLIGIDLRKPKEMLLPAYDDAAGVTAEFNLNLLAHVNRALDADFELELFRHEAVWDDETGRMEIRVRSLADQVVTISGKVFTLRRDERIITEYSHKYTLDQFSRIARSYWTEAIWADPREWFCVQLLRPRAETFDEA